MMQPHAPTADDDLLRRIYAREATAVALLYDRYGGVAYALAAALVGEGSVAEEVVQEVFVTVWREGETAGDACAPIRARLLAAVRRCAIARLDRGHKHPAGLRPPRPGTATREDPGEGETLVQRGGGVLGLLPPEEWRSVLLAYLGGYTHDEIDRMVETPAGTTTGRLRRGLQTLRSHLRRDDTDAVGEDAVG